MKIEYDGNIEYMMKIEKIEYDENREYDENTNNNNNNIFFNYKLLNPLVDQDLKPTCPEREVSCTEHSQNQMTQINTEKTIYMWEMLD